MIDFAIEFEATHAQAFIDERRNLLADILAERMDHVNLMMAERVRGNLTGAVLQNRTGRLLDTVKVLPAQRAGEELYASVMAGGEEAPYGIYFEEGGTEYYTIAPVNKRALAFMVGGQQMFARLVNHPPIPKLPWFAPEQAVAIDEMKPQLQQAVNEALA